MTRAFFPPAALATALSAASPASATATLSCNAEADGARFAFMASVGADQSLSGVRAEWTAPLAALGEGRVVARRLGKTTLTLRLRWGADAKPAADLLLFARQAREDDYAGRFRLKIAGGAKRSGSARCQLGY